MNFEQLKRQINLLDIVGTQLKHVATTGGGEWAGPCPFCGGRDRFRVQPNHPDGGRWFCRQCTPEDHWHDVFDFVAKRDNTDLKGAFNILAGSSPELPRASVKVRKAPRKAYAPPVEEWQQAAGLAMEVCSDNLYKPIGAPALEYLKGRGLLDRTIRYYRLGYSPGTKFGSLYIPAGVVIPCIATGNIWYLKIRTLPGSGAKPKYLGVKGNRTAAIFGTDDLKGAEEALFCEGEFNAMIAAQEIGDILPVATFGAANNRPDLATWGPYLIPLRLILVAYDPDTAGENGALALAELLGNRVKLAGLPGPGDLNEWYLAGGDLYQWIKTELDFHAPLLDAAISGKDSEIQVL